MHSEDMDTGAANFLHWGKPKVWYVVALESAVKMENIISALVKKAPKVSKQYKKCENIFRHKEFVVTPKFLDDHEIEHTIIFQNEGEFVVTFPRGYHMGWNLGLNFAEATNFANKDWIPFGLAAKQCTCDWSKKTKANLLKFPMEPFLA